MRIHLYSHSFTPSLGGMERLAQLLADQFAQQGHDVTVATETPGEANLPYPVVRAPNAAEYLRLARASDVILSMPLSLRRLPAQILSGRPVVVAHPILYPEQGHVISTALKRCAARLVTSVVPSQFMAGHFPGAQVIPNPYDAATFCQPSRGQPRSGVLYVGRLSAEKGCDLLIEAFARSSTACQSHLTIVGTGPQQAALEKQAAALGIAGQVKFHGALAGTELAAVMQGHAVMAVPTRCHEAFGIVALEGLACGCSMIVADSGGLPEAVGPLALTFPREDVEALADCLDRALSPDDHPPSAAAVAAHLARFRPERIAADYLAVLEAAVSQGRLAAVRQPL